MRDSFFESGENAAVYPTLCKKISVEYVVLGGSLCAALTAYYLNQAKKSVALLAPDVIGGDGTQYLLPRADVSGYYYEKSKIILNELDQIGEDFFKRDLFFFSDRKRHEKRLRSFAEAVNGDFYTSEKACEKFSFDVCAGVYAKNCSAVLNPVKTAKSLAAAISLSGGFVFEKSPVKDIQNIGGYFIPTAKGEIFAEKIADCREVLFDKNEYGLTPYICCSFDAEDIEGWHEKCSLSDCYKKSLSFCFFKDKIYAAAAVSTISSLSRFYINYKSIWIRDVFEKMFFCSNLYKPSTLFLTYGKTLVHGEPVIKKIDKNYYSSLCPFENGIISSVITAKEFVKMY
ncbi:MAG: hypothetical protein DBX47_04725 [Clostridiales bacterium]|nr:MAG: hypothetical protein DBX47_04725 [Clostridiales bacterium]